MGKPTLYPIAPFDKTIGTVLYFTYSGNQAVKNKVVIRENTSNTIVYEKEYETFQLKHKLDPTNLSSLENGKQYNVTVQVFDSSGTGSPISTPGLFYCFTTPQFSISNITQGQIIQSSYLPVNVSYFQQEDEPINQYSISLYDAGHQKISSSNILYSIPVGSDSYTFSGLLDDNTYYIKAQGTTVHGFAFDTGFIQFSVNYITPSAFYLLELANQYEMGSIKIQSNIIMITGESDSNEYTEDNSCLIITNGRYAKFSEGYVINGDFALSFIGNAQDNKVILELVGSDCRATVTNIVEYSDPFDTTSAATKHVVLRVSKNDMTYELHSNSVDYDVEYKMFIRRMGDLFSIEITE